MMKKRWTKKSKRAFTLLEIIVCISLLSLIGGLFATKAKDLFSTYHYRTQKTRFVNALMLARHLSIAYSADIEAIISKEKSGYSLFLKTDEPALYHHCMLFQKMNYSHIEKIELLTDQKKEDLHMKVLFSSSGWLFPSGSLKLSSKEQASETLDLGVTLNQSN